MAGTTRRALSTAIAILVVSGFTAYAAASDTKERQISIKTLHIGLTPGGRVGVYVAYTPRYPRELTTVSVAIGTRPRMVYGFYKGGQIISSPLRDVFPNDNDLRAGRSYKVRLSFCWTKTPERARSTRVGPAAHAAKIPCDRRTFTSRQATLQQRFDPPG